MFILKGRPFISSCNFFAKRLIHSDFKSSTHNNSKALTDFNEQLQKELKDIKDGGLWKDEKIITTKQGTKVGIEGKNGLLLNFCATNYLGLSDHPEVLKAGRESLDKYGGGTGSIQSICANQLMHKDLESKIAKFHEREAAILYASSFHGNKRFFEQILTPSDVVIYDELNNPSNIDGIKFSNAQKFQYLHKDMLDLESKLIEAQELSPKQKFIVTDGFFSMDGDVAPLSEISKLSQKYNGIIVVDESHSVGFLGKRGRGTEEFFSDQNEKFPKVNIIISSLGNAFGGTHGGYTTGSKELIESLRPKIRPLLSSSPLPPHVVSCALKNFEIFLNSSSILSKIEENTTVFRDGMKKAGFKILGHENHPICPIFIGDDKLTSEFEDKMQDEGINVMGVSFPFVPKGKAQIRVQISGAHQKSEIKKAIDVFIKVGKNLQVI